MPAFIFQPSDANDYSDVCNINDVKINYERNDDNCDAITDELWFILLILNLL